MIDNWAFGRRIAAGFALSLVLLVIIGSIAYASISMTGIDRYPVRYRSR